MTPMSSNGKNGFEIFNGKLLNLTINYHYSYKQIKLGVGNFDYLISKWRMHILHFTINYMAIYYFFL